MAAESLIGKLVNAGWADDGDPYQLMEALKMYIPKVSEDAVGVLIDEFNKVTAEDQKTLHGALGRAQYVKGRTASLVGMRPDL